MATGTIKRVISDRGFGFIGGEDGKEYFFHRNELAESLDFDRLVGGETVSFDVESSPKGPRAVKVTTAALGWFSPRPSGRTFTGRPVIATGRSAVRARVAIGPS